MQDAVNCVNCTFNLNAVFSKRLLVVCARDYRLHVGLNCSSRSTIEGNSYDVDIQYAVYDINKVFFCWKKQERKSYSGWTVWIH